MTRTDIHRPGLMVPADYTEVMYFEQPDFLEQIAYSFPGVADEARAEIRRANELYRKDGAHIHGGIFQCDVCGARYKRGSLFQHKDGQLISVGHECADKIAFLRDSAGADALHDRLQQANLRELERLEREASAAEWKAGNPELWDKLQLDHPIMRDIRERLQHSHFRFGLSEGQERLVRKLWDEAHAAPEKHVPVPVNGARIELEGTVVGMKVQESMYGNTLKMTLKVETPEGSWLVYGTAPRQLLDAANDEWKAEVAGAQHGGVDHRGQLRGRKVSFKATVVPGDREPHFGFFSRPSGGRIIQ
jgi:hypothetical protein